MNSSVPCSGGHRVLMSIHDTAIFCRQPGVGCHRGRLRASMSAGHEKDELDYRPARLNFRNMVKSRGGRALTRSDCHWPPARSHFIS